MTALGNLTPEDLALIVNALREKANGDREAIADALSAPFPIEVGALNKATARLADTLEGQAARAEAIADAFENNDFVIHPRRPSEF